MKLKFFKNPIKEKTMTPKMNKDEQQITFRIKKETMKLFKERCAKMGLSVSAGLRLLIIESLKEREYRNEGELK